MYRPGNFNKKKEKRIDAADDEEYSMEEFVECYGRELEWHLAGIDEEVRKRLGGLAEVVAGGVGGSVPMAEVAAKLQEAFPGVVEGVVAKLVDTGSIPSSMGEAIKQASGGQPQQPNLTSRMTELVGADALHAFRTTEVTAFIQSTDATLLSTSRAFVDKFTQLFGSSPLLFTELLETLSDSEKAGTLHNVYRTIAITAAHDIDFDVLYGYYAHSTCPEELYDILAALGKADLASVIGGDVTSVKKMRSQRLMTKLRSLLGDSQLDAFRHDAVGGFLTSSHPEGGLAFYEKLETAVGISEVTDGLITDMTSILDDTQKASLLRAVHTESKTLAPPSATFRRDHLFPFAHLDAPLASFYTAFSAHVADVTSFSLSSLFGGVHNPKACNLEAAFNTYHETYTKKEKDLRKKAEAEKRKRQEEERRKAKEETAKLRKEEENKNREEKKKKEEARKQKEEEERVRREAEKKKKEEAKKKQEEQEKKRREGERKKKEEEDKQRKEEEKRAAKERTERKRAEKELAVTEEKQQKEEEAKQYAEDIKRAQEKLKREREADAARKREAKMNDDSRKQRDKEERREREREREAAKRKKQEPSPREVEKVPMFEPAVDHTAPWSKMPRVFWEMNPKCAKCGVLLTRKPCC